MRRKGKAQEGVRNSFKRVPCIIGIDQSYTRTGISICVNGKLKKVSSIDFTQREKYNKTEKRKEVIRVVNLFIEKCLTKFSSEEINIVVERVRTFTATDNLRPDFIKAQGALIAVIVDVAYDYGIKVWSVDTRCWKSSVLGSSKPIFDPVPGVKDPQKFGAVRKVIELGFLESIQVKRSKNSVVNLDDDAADSACIALYPFTFGTINLTLEQ